MIKSVVLALGLSLLVACGGGEEEVVAVEVVKDPETMIMDACREENVLNRICVCLSTTLKENLSPALFADVASSIAAGENPDIWLSTVSEEDFATAENAAGLARACIQ